MRLEKEQATATADPCGMTTRKAKATVKAKATAKANAKAKANADSSLRSEWKSKRGKVDGKSYGNVKS